MTAINKYAKIRSGKREKNKKNSKIPRGEKMKYIELGKRIEESRQDYISKKELEKAFRNIYRNVY